MDVGAADAVLKPGLGIFDAEGSVPIPELELVEAAEVGLGRWLIVTYLFTCGRTENRKKEMPNEKKIMSVLETNFIHFPWRWMSHTLQYTV